jgi:hypothetical protein
MNCVEEMEDRQGEDDEDDNGNYDEEMEESFQKIKYVLKTLLDMSKLYPLLLNWLMNRRDNHPSPQAAMLCVKLQYGISKDFHVSFLLGS